MTTIPEAEDRNLLLHWRVLVMSAGPIVHSQPISSQNVLFLPTPVFRSEAPHLSSFAPFASPAPFLLRFIASSDLSSSLLFFINRLRMSFGNLRKIPCESEASGFIECREERNVESAEPGHTRSSVHVCEEVSLSGG